MKVYIVVSEHWYGGHPDIIRVFSSKEEAQEYIDELWKTEEHDRTDFIILEKDLINSANFD